MDDRRIMTRNNVVFLLLLLMGCFQFFFEARECVGLFRDKVIPNRFLDSIERSADVTYGTDYLSYIVFLRQHVPQDAVVVITKSFGLPQYDDIDFMSYFLFPRTVVGVNNSICADEFSLRECISRMSGPNTYFLYGPNFNLATSTPDGFSALPFSDNSGLIIPNE